MSKPIDRFDGALQRAVELAKEEGMKDPLVAHADYWDAAQTTLKKPAWVLFLQESDPLEASSAVTTVGVEICDDGDEHVVAG